MSLKYKGMEVQRHSFLASTPTISEWSALGPGRLNRRMDMPYSRPGLSKAEKNLFPLPI